MNTCAFQGLWGPGANWRLKTLQDFERRFKQELINQNVFQMMKSDAQMFWCMLTTQSTEEEDVSVEDVVLHAVVFAVDPSV